LKEAFEREAWKHERLFAGGMTRQPPISFHDYVHAPYPVGLGYDYAMIRGFIERDVELLKLYEAEQQPAAPILAEAEPAPIDPTKRQRKPRTKPLDDPSRPRNRF
jgi:hypothetical protein